MLKNFCFKTIKKSRLKTLQLTIKTCEHSWLYVQVTRISHADTTSAQSVLWRDGDGEACDKVVDEMDDVDLYDDMIGADDMEELFGDSDEDDE